MRWYAIESPAGVLRLLAIHLLLLYKTRCAAQIAAGTLVRPGHRNRNNSDGKKHDRLVKMMRRRTLRAGLAVGLTAALAGCSSLRSARTETDELVAAVESVPGVEDGRIVSASTLGDAHHDAVAGFKRSATRRGTITNSPVGSDESHGTVHTKIRIDDGTFFHRITRVDRAGGVTSVGPAQTRDRDTRYARVFHPAGTRTADDSTLGRPLRSRRNVRRQPRGRPDGSG